MGQDSAIEWTDHTFNPWWGCAKISPGCKNCYAEGIARRWGGDIWGIGKPKKLFSESHWTQPFDWNRIARLRGSRFRVFCASMADVFDAEAPIAERNKLWNVIESTPHLDWQILTKRPDNIMRSIPTAWASTPPKNVWLGTSVENADYVWRIAELTKVPAVVHFLSLEPLLGPIPNIPLKGINWVIVGGESGSSARPMLKEWASDLLKQCVESKVPYFFKQWGSHNARGEKVGKKSAGRLLQGRHWNSMPQIATLSHT